MEAFLRLLTEHERTLGIYVTGLVQSVHDAEDILQEGKIVMWRDFAKFSLGTNFLAWSRKILLHQIFAYRRKVKKRQDVVTLSDGAIALLDEEMDSAQRENRWIMRESALEQCVSKLKAKHREVIGLRYRDEASIEKIALKTDKSEKAIYQLLFRLRKTLFDCVDERLKSN